MWYAGVAKRKKERRGIDGCGETRKKEVYKRMNDGQRRRRKEMKVGVNWHSQMQMVAFMLIAVICFFMPIRTRPEWAGGQLSACSALITVRRSFIWRTFIYSFNFLSFMCSARTPHHGDTVPYAVWNALQIFDRQMSSELSLHFMSEWWIVFVIYFGRTGMYPQKEKFLRLRFTVSFPSAVQSGRPLADISDVVQVMLLLPVSPSEAGREGCYDRTCKSIPFSGKQRLIPQWPDGCRAVGSRPQIWVGWYQTDSRHLSPQVQRGMK